MACIECLVATAREGTCLSPSAIEATCLSPVVICPPVLEVTMVSDSRECVLCGFYEYADISTPPKRYLRATYSGTVSSERRDVLVPAFGNPPGWGCFDAGSSHILSVVETFSGQARVSSSTCLYLTNANLEIVSEVASTVNVAVPPGTPADLVPYVLPANTCDSDYTVVPATSTTWQRTQTGACCVVGFSGLGYPQFADIVTGFVHVVLSEEDTDANAINRATSVLGTLNIAKYQARSAFNFLWQSIAVDFDLTELVVGSPYKITLPIVTENYGGGSPVSSNLEYTFTASSGSETVSDLIVAAIGKQVTLGEAVVTRL